MLHDKSIEFICECIIIIKGYCYYLNVFLSGLRGHGLLFLLLPDILPMSVAGIFRRLAPVLLLGVYWKLSAYIIVQKCCDVIGIGL